MTRDNISREALSLIAALNLQYWCEDEEEKNILKQIYIENGKRNQEKYKYENLFKKENMNEIQTKEMNLITYKKESSIVVKMIKRIKSWLKKKNFCF